MPTLILHAFNPLSFQTKHSHSYLKNKNNMKLRIINPTKLFKSKNSISRNYKTDPCSFSSNTSSLSEQTGSSTPTTVLPINNNNNEVYFDIKQAFNVIDRDGDGKVHKKELESLLNRLGTEPMSHEELESMLNEVDRDGDGCISLEEFSDAIGEAFMPLSCDSELKQVFEFFDTDHDGKITAEELHGVFETIGDRMCTLEECKRMINGVDTNGEGFVCFEDFTRMMVHQL